MSDPADLDPIVGRLLDRWPLGHLATITRAGQPHLVPVVFCREGTVLFSPVDGKRKRHQALKRLDNVTARPEATLLLDGYDADWTRLWWVRLDGTASRYRPEHEHRQHLRAQLLAKYPQYGRTPPDSSQPTYLRFTWTTVRVWTETGTTEPIIRAIDHLGPPHEEQA